MFRVLSLALVACLLMAGSAFADMKIGVFNSPVSYTHLTLPTILRV